MARSAKTVKTATRRALVVAGMHRSGTSAMARLLSLSGAILPERLMAPGADNPAGFWEPWEMVALSDRILAACESRWDDVFALSVAERAQALAPSFLSEAKAFVTDNFGDADLLVMKDPRSSVLAPFWRAALDGLGIKPLYVIMVRNPLAVARSLAQRNGFSTERSVLLWTSYMLAVERDTRGHDRLFLSYDAVLDDWRSALAAVEVALGQPLPLAASDAAADIEGFLNRDHRHHEATAEDLSSRTEIWAAAQEVLAWLDAAVQGAAPPGKVLDAAAAELAELESKIGAVCVDLRRETIDLREEATRAAGLQAELDAAGAMIKELHARADDATQRAQGVTLQADAERAQADAERAQANAERAQADAERAQAERDLAWHRDENALWRQRAASEQAKAAIFQRARDEREREAAMAHLRVAELEAVTSAQVGHIAQLQVRGSALEALAQAQAEHIGQLQDAVALLQSSTSWRLTAPLRWAIRRLRPG